MKYLNYLIIIISALLILLALPAYASSLPSSLGQCGDSSSQFETLAESLPSAGTFYVKLSNQQEPTTNVTLYFQSIDTGQCQLVGSANAQYGHWTAIGSLNSISSAGGFIIASGDGLGAYPYSSVLTSLIVAKPSVCQPIINCAVNYLGQSAVLEPTIISHATDQVAIYVAKPLTGISYSKVSYYDNGNYLYGGTVYKPINRNYLGGGVHNIDIQLSLKDGQTVDIYQKVNMGNDITGMLFIKSRLYQSRDKALLFVLAGALVVILGLILVIARLIYKRRRFVIDHGLNKLPEEIAVTATEDETIVGKF
jgi:hypothetical protein